MKRVLSVGECMIEFSAADEGLWRMGFAGDTLNTAWALRALLSPDQWDVGYFTRLGEDGFSDRMIAFLVENGLSTRWIGRDSERGPGLYCIELVDGERSFTYWRDRSAAKRLAEDTVQLESAFHQTDLIHVSGITFAILEGNGRETLLRALAEARAAGRRIAFDTNIRPRLWSDMASCREAVMAAAAVATIVLPSFDDEQSTFGDGDPAATARRYLDAGAAEVVVKRGGDPALVVAEGQETEVPTVAARLVDSTGAGDSFNAGYLAGRLTGMAPPEAAALGHAVAARVISHRGALAPMAELTAVANAHALV